MYAGIGAPLYIPFVIFMFFYYRKTGQFPAPIAIFTSPFMSLWGLPTPPPAPPTPTPPTPTPPTPNCPTCPTCPDHPTNGRLKAAPVNISYTQTTNGVATSGSLPTVTIGQLPGIAKNVKKYQNFMAENGITVTYSDPSIQFVNQQAQDEWTNLRSRQTGPIGYNRHGN